MIRRPFPIRQHIATAAAIGFVTLTSAPAWAAGSNMPWEQPLNQILGEAGAHDPGCLHAWAENRRRFLGGATRPSEPSPVELFPGARTAPNVATDARPLDQPTPKDER